MAWPSKEEPWPPTPIMPKRTRSLAEPAFNLTSSPHYVLDSDIRLVAAGVMQMRDLPIATGLYPNGGEADIRVRTQASDYGHVAVMMDFLFQIGRRNPNRASGFHRRYLLRLGLRFFTIGDNGEIFGFQAGEGVAITAIVCLHPLLF